MASIRTILIVWRRHMSDFLEKLGRRVRHFRMGKKLTQEGVAELCGLSAKYISDLECGKANVTVRVLDKVAASLGNHPI